MKVMSPNEILIHKPFFVLSTFVEYLHICSYLLCNVVQHNLPLLI